MGKTFSTGLLTNGIWQDSSNNVGIGAAANASFKLQVTGTTNLTGALSGTSATFSGNLNLQAGVTRNINFYDSSNTNINAQIQYDQIASNSGQLLFGTNNAGTFATRLTIANTGAATFSSTLQSGSITIKDGGNNGQGTLNLGSTNGYFIQGGADYTAMNFYTNATERMRITSGGQVGIGTTSVDSTISVDIQNLSSTSNNVFLRLKNNAVSEDCGIKIAGIFGTAYEHTIGVNTIIGSGDLCFHNSNTLGYRWFIDGSQKLGITSGGNVLIGTTSAGTDFTRTAAATTSANVFGLVSTDDSSGAGFIQFRNSATTSIGSITRITTTNAVAYNTTSDYRLKEDLKEIKGLKKVCAIKVYDFKWKDNEYRMDGVLAHELAEVIPFAVHGEKDAEEMQSVDYSKIVPSLVAAIQEQQAQIEELKALINK